MKKIARKLIRQLNKHFDSIEESNLQRSKKNEIAKYNRKYLVYPLSFLLLLSLYFLYKNLQYPQSIPEIIKQNPNSYYGFWNALVYFSKNAKVKNKIKLPFRNLEQFKDFDKSNIWYEFQIDIPDNYYKESSTGVFIPKIYGKSRVFIDGGLVDFGQDNRNAIAVSKQNFTVKIHVDATNSMKYGIRAIYPIVAGNINQLRQFNNIIFKETEVFPKAFIAQLLTLFLFVLIFITIREKPELFTFILFYLSCLFYQYICFTFATNKTVFNLSFVQYNILMSAINFIRSSLLIWFLFDFFRFSKKRLRTAMKSASILFVFLFFPLLFTLRFKLGANSSPFVIFNLFQESFFLLFSTYIIVESVLFLLFRLKHYSRILVAVPLFIAIIYNSSANIYDFFVWGIKLATPYMNNIYTYFAVALITIVEFARTERDRKELSLNLPKEQQEKFNKRVGRLKSFHEGYIILIDLISFSKIQEDIREEGLEKLAHSINIHLLKHFNACSILNNTGDGFYFSVEKAFNLENTQLVLKSVEELFENNITFAIDNKVYPLKFRVAIGYGRYYVGFSRYKNLMRDFSTGKILTQVSRIISRDQRPKLRILINDYTKELVRKFDQAPFSETAKHGYVYTCLEFETMQLKKLLDTKLAA